MLDPGAHWAAAAQVLETIKWTAKIYPIVLNVVLCVVIWLGSDLRLPHHPSPPVSSSNSLNIGETKIFRKRVLGLNLSLDDLSSPNLGVQFWHRQELKET